MWSVGVIPVKFIKLRLAAGWLFIIAVIYLSLTPSPPGVALTKSGFFLHLSSYALLMAWFAVLYSPNFHMWLGLGFVSMGVSLEILQGFTGYRAFEYVDILANSVGVLLGWFLAKMHTESLEV